MKNLVHLKTGCAYMNRPSFIKPALATCAASLLLTGCVVREVRYQNPPPPMVIQQPGPPGAGEVIVSSAPPPPVEETITIAPGPEFVWVPGVWVWEGRWRWHHGYWGRPPRPGAVWVPHHYVYRNGVHVFVRGGWR